MTQPPPRDPTKEAVAAINLLSTINKLTLKAFQTKKRQALVFLIVNDTILLTRYDRAVLWAYDGTTSKPRLLGVSGQSAINTTTSIAKQWVRLLQALKSPNQSQILSPDSFKQDQELWTDYTHSSSKPSILWLPIFANEKMGLGLWLERWEENTWAKQDAEILNLLTPAYGAAWEKFSKVYALQNRRSKWIWTASLIGLLLLFTIRIPLRIVAPCEIVPKDPFLVTAPLEDIVDQLNVKPGQKVKKGDLLFSYDKRVALKSLAVAEKQIEVAKQDLNRAKTLAFKEEKALAEVNVLMAKLKKEEANLELAKYHASQLVVYSNQEGIIMLDDPDQWRGKPVKVGEKILMIIDPQNTKIRLWIPESDNVKLDLNRTIRIILNVSPTITREAMLNFISNATTITDKHLVSFMAEAEWIQPQNDVQVGLKGTAILYGEKVSLFYWIIRKPWASVRDYIGF